MANSKLIVIEGLDGVGKNTQSNLLTKYLSEKYGDTVLYSFPRYHSPTGKRVADYLNGGLDELTLLEKAKLYADDRFAVREAILDNLNSGLNVVCDRYILSNMYFVAMAKIAVMDNECESANYPDLTRASILHLEYCQNKMPVPDLTIVLECPVEVTIEQVKAKAKRDYTDEKQDLHERNERLLRSTAEIYSNLRRHHPGVCNVWCADDQGKIRSIEEIAEMINTSVDLVMQNETSNIFIDQPAEVKDRLWPKQATLWETLFK